MKYQFNKMTEEDLVGVLRVEENAFSTPWTEELFRHELTGNAYSYYVVMKKEEEVIGYCGSWIVLDECHITNIAIHSDYRGKGLGEALMLEMINRSRAVGVQSMTLEVRVSNVIAQGLYTKLGFQPGGIRKNYYADDREDALVMWVEWT